jgi:hypothetical protein
MGLLSHLNVRLNFFVTILGVKFQYTPIKLFFIKANTMENLEHRLDYLEAVCDTVKMQNRVLATALQATLRALPQDIAQDIAESIQAAFEDELAELNYTNSTHADLFQDAVDDFFREKR